MTRQEENRQTVTQQARAYVARLVRDAKAAWETIWQRVLDFAGSKLYEILFRFHVGPEPSQEAERAERAAKAIAEQLGPDPAEALADAPADKRLDILLNVHTAVAGALGMQDCALESCELTETDTPVRGRYSPRKDEIQINSDVLEKQPFSETDALLMLETICHETYHAFQFQAIAHPGALGVSIADATIWRDNFNQYIYPFQNPRRYRSQSVEATANDFAAAILAQFYKEDDYGTA